MEESVQMKESPMSSSGSPRFSLPYATTEAALASVPLLDVISSMNPPGADLGGRFVCSIVDRETGLVWQPLMVAKPANHDPGTSSAIQELGTSSVNQNPAITSVDRDSESVGPAIEYISQDDNSDAASMVPYAETRATPVPVVSEDLGDVVPGQVYLRGEKKDKRKLKFVHDYCTMCSQVLPKRLGYKLLYRDMEEKTSHVSDHSVQIEASFQDTFQRCFPHMQEAPHQVLLADRAMETPNMSVSPRAVVDVPGPSSTPVVSLESEKDMKSQMSLDSYIAECFLNEAKSDIDLTDSEAIFDNFDGPSETSDRPKQELKQGVCTTMRSSRERVAYPPSIPTPPTIPPTQDTTLEFSFFEDATISTESKLQPKMLRRAKKHTTTRIPQRKRKVKTEKGIIKMKSRKSDRTTGTKKAGDRTGEAKTRKTNWTLDAKMKDDMTREIKMEKKEETDRKNGERTGRVKAFFKSRSLLYDLRKKVTELHEWMEQENLTYYSCRFHNCSYQLPRSKCKGNFYRILQKHLCFHNEIRPIQCSHCQEDLWIDANVKGHVNLHARRNELLPHIPTSQNFVNHLKNYEPELMNALNVCFPAEMIDQVGFEPELSKRRRPSHVKDEQKKLLKVRVGLPNLTQAMNRVFSHMKTNGIYNVQCSHIDCRYNLRFVQHGGTLYRAIRNHLCLHGNIRPVQCRYCEETFRTDDNPGEHLAIHLERNEVPDIDTPFGHFLNRSPEFENQMIGLLHLCFPLDSDA